ncbi:MAG: adenylate/guanylate cyclase domain-containing protein [Polyangiaceae bacterium]|nr:adenylate/guanylate cyclase domain-containing protein [Polyangiaceae bacterium]
MSTHAPFDERFVHELIRWILSPSTRSLPLDGFLAELSVRLRAGDITVARMRTSVTTKHPEVFVRAVMWHETLGVDVRDGLRDLLTTPTFLASPVAKVRAEGVVVRCRLQGPEADLSYSICGELAAEGLTDYVVYPMQFGSGERTYFSFATRREGGFSDSHLAVFEQIAPALAIRIEVESAELALKSLLQVYLGQNAAARVLAGSFLRGTGERIHAAVWFCDMRGFTTLADRKPAHEVVKILDRFFECVAGPIGPLGGEVLKFIGDAVLAIFPVRSAGVKDACERALEAANAAVDGVAKLNSEGGDTLVDMGVGLHVGEVMYGNIGARDRLDFTVIGSVVNEVCRVESLCRTLDSPILLTAAFARYCSGAAVESRGVHTLKGVLEPQEIFAPKRA